MTRRRTFDNYDSIASEVMTMAATGGQTLETMEEIADLLRSTFPPSTSSLPDGRTLPVAAPSGSRREGALTELESGI